MTCQVVVAMKRFEMIKFHNTLTNEIEPLTPSKAGGSLYITHGYHMPISGISDIRFEDLCGGFWSCGLKVKYDEYHGRGRQDHCRRPTRTKTSGIYSLHTSFLG